MSHHQSSLDGDHSRLLRDSLHTGSVATVATTIAAMICGKVETGSALAPVNAVSHILWEDEAARQDDASLRHTGMGLLLNTAAVTSWAVVYEMLFGRGRSNRNAIEDLLGGVCVSSLAFVTDYYVVPKRFTPGFEKRLSNSSLLVIYAALAAGLGTAGALRTVSKR